MIHMFRKVMIYGIHMMKRKVNKNLFKYHFFSFLLEKVRSLVGPELAAYTDQIYQTYDWKVPNHIIKKPSKLPAIEKPLPGTSYNPTYDDHQVKNFIFNILFNSKNFSSLGFNSKSC